jgi:hypothetical protein
VVAEIEHQRAILASNAGYASRLKAPRYLAHLLGDIHQHLHAGYQDDRGENRFQLREFMRVRNLHTLWDSGQLHHRALDNAAVIAVLQNLLQAPRAQAWRVAQMAQESCRIVAQAGLYPSNCADEGY